jgi:hypothetical protein
MRIAKRILKVGFLAVVLLLILIILRHPHQRYTDAAADPVFSGGNAPEGVRSEIVKQLRRFQEGYTGRDLDQVDAFVEELFSQEEILVLGTMPDEVYNGPEEVADLVYADWNTWGDCTFLMDNAHISAAGDAAWISTVGYVEFDLWRYLVLPLRLSGVMVKEDSGWKFQYLQFRFDLTLFPLFVVIPLLMVGLAVSLVSLGVVVAQEVRGRE